MSTGAPSSPLLHFPQPSSAAAVRLFCVPYAGGGATVFKGWHTALPGIEVALVRLPGRETRFHDEPYVTMAPLVADLAAAITACTDRPYALFGHSMGARIAFEVARRLRTDGFPRPRQLFVSGCRAPQLPLRMPAHHLPREQFLEHLREMGGAPPEFFVEPELVELVLPMLRADFSVAETYAYTPAEPLDVPVRAFCGTADPHVSPAQTAAWGEQTTSRFGLTSVPGGHFFLESERASLLRAIRDDLLDAGRAAPVGERAR